MLGALLAGLGCGRDDVHPPQKIIMASRKLGFRQFSSASHIKLFQFDVCPYCCATKAVLCHLKLLYSTIEVNPLNKAELKRSSLLSSKSYLKVPIAVINGSQINGSEEIIDKVYSLAAVPSDDSLVVSPHRSELISWAYDSLVMYDFLGV